MTTSVEQQLDQFNDKLAKYQVLARKSWPEVIAKQGKKLAYSLSLHLLGMAPAKGAIRAELTERLRSGLGIRVRDTARRYATKHSVATVTKIQTRTAGIFMEKTRTGKIKRAGLNWWQLAVKREIGLRESGRGFLGRAFGYPSLIGRRKEKAVNRYATELSSYGLTINPDGATGTFTLDPAVNPQEANAAAGMSKPRARAIIALALRDTSDDMQIYIARKMEDSASEAGLK